MTAWAVILGAAIVLSPLAIMAGALWFAHRVLFRGPWGH